MSQQQQTMMTIM